MAKRHVDKERLERADREAKASIHCEREARNAKTARLREMRLRHEAATVEEPQTSRTPRLAKKLVDRRIEVDG